MKISFLVYPALSVMLLFTACRRDDEVADAISLMAEQVANFDDLMENAENFADQYFEEFSGRTNCPVVSADQPRGVFPVKVTLDFGSTGCRGIDGRFRSGKIHIYRTDSVLKAGSVRIVSLENYKVEGISVKGTRTWQNLGTDSLGRPRFGVTTTGGELVFQDGSNITFEGNHLVTFLEGFDNWILLDNVFSITGVANGFTRNGTQWTSQITDPLIRKLNCRWITDGVRKIEINNNSYIIDFGNGECDRRALLTLPNGNTRVVWLRP